VSRAASLAGDPPICHVKLLASMDMIHTGPSLRVIIAIDGKPMTRLRLWLARHKQTHDDVVKSNRGESANPRRRNACGEARDSDVSDVTLGRWGGPHRSSPEEREV
jgi:hypothetical protein